MLITPYYKAFINHFYIKILMLSVLKLFIFLWLYVCVYDLHVWVGMHTCQGTCTGTCMWKGGRSEDNVVELFISFTVTWVPEIKLNSSSLHNEHLCSQSHHSGPHVSLLLPFSYSTSLLSFLTNLQFLYTDWKHSSR